MENSVSLRAVTKAAAHFPRSLAIVLKETLFRAKEAFYHKCVLGYPDLYIFTPPFKIVNVFHGIYV